MQQARRFPLVPICMNLRNLTLLGDGMRNEIKSENCQFFNKLLINHRVHCCLEQGNMSEIIHQESIAFFLRLN